MSGFLRKFYVTEILHEVADPGFSVGGHAPVGGGGVDL